MTTNGNPKGTSERTQKSKRQGTAAVRTALESRSGKHSQTPLIAGVVVGLVVVGVLVAGLYRAMNATGEAKSAEVAKPATTAKAPVTKPTSPAVPVRDDPQGGAALNEILLGMVGPFSGPNKELGRGMKTGIELAFAEANEAGGIEGRRLNLVALDDGYEPSRTTQVIKELVEERKVFAVVGNVGSATAAVSVPYLISKKVLLLGAFSGSPVLRRDPPDRYVFNFRPSTTEEAEVLTRYLLESKRFQPKEIAVFAQQDEFGEAGYAGVVQQVRRSANTQEPLLRVTYKRNSADVTSAVTRIREAAPKAVIMIATYHAAATFVQKVRESGLRPVFAGVSEIQPAAFSEELLQAGGPSLTENVIITQVVPPPTSNASVVMRYRWALGKYTVGEKPGYCSLEGYIVGSILVEGLRRTSRNFDTEKLIDALESIRGLDFGLGVPITFGPKDRQASRKVWSTMLEPSGSYRPVE